MNLLKLVFILVVSCFLSCQRKTSEIDTSAVIDWDNVSLGSFEVENIEYVPLETTDSSLLGRINKVLFRNNHFYVLDKMSGGVYVFDKMGKFISSLVKPGEGPEEYVELMDMDVDKNGNIYVSDNAKMKILKYRFPLWSLEKVFNVGEHYMEFCCLDEDCFLLKDIFGREGLEMKLAHFDGTKSEITPLVGKKYSSMNELEVMSCSKFSLYRSGDVVYYNERFTPNIFSVTGKGKLSKVYRLISDKYVSEENLKGLRNNPMKFLLEKESIKDIVGLYENESFFVCTPFISPSAECLLVPKKDVLKATLIDLSVKPEFIGTSSIEGVADERFFTILKIPNEKALENDERLVGMEEDSNPILMLFRLKLK